MGAAGPSRRGTRAGRPRLATRAGRPRRYMPARPRRFERSAHLGFGADLFDRASRALMNWDMHRGAGLVVVVDGPASPGRTVTLRPTSGPAAWLRLSAPCEVTDVIDGPGARGFTYRSLPGHPERGWETFVVTSDPDTGAVRLTITAESTHATLLARLGAPIARREQDRITGRYLEALSRL